MYRVPTAEYAMVYAPEEGEYNIDLYSTNQEVGNFKAQVGYEVGNASVTVEELGIDGLNLFVQTSHIKRYNVSGCFSIPLA